MQYSLFSWGVAFSGKSLGISVNASVLSESALCGNLLSISSKFLFLLDFVFTTTSVRQVTLPDFGWILSICSGKTLFTNDDQILHSSMGYGAKYLAISSMSREHEWWNDNNRNGRDKNGNNNEHKKWRKNTICPKIFSNWTVESFCDTYWTKLWFQQFNFSLRDTFHRNFQSKRIILLSLQQRGWE